LQGKLTLLETLANRTIIRGKFGEKEASMDDRLHALKDEYQRLNKQGFKRFGILNTDGIAFFTSGKQLYLGDKEHFIKALKGESTVSSVLISQYENEPIYAFTTPIKDTLNEKIIGVLFAASDAKELSKMIASISHGKSGYAFIVDTQGTIIAHKDFSKVLHQENLLTPSNLELSGIASRNTYDKRQCLAKSFSVNSVSSVAYQVFRIRFFRPGPATAPGWPRLPSTWPGRLRRGGWRRTARP